MSTNYMDFIFYVILWPHPLVDQSVLGRLMAECSIPPVRKPVVARSAEGKGAEQRGADFGAIELCDLTDRGARDAYQ